MVHINDLTMTYTSGGRSLTVLDRINLEVPSRQFLSIIGPSGSGKTTLLGLMAGLDRPSSGAVRIADRNLAEMGEDELARYRSATVGIVFQSFYLIPTLTALENVQVPLELLGRPAEEEARRLLSAVGLEDRKDHFPAQLSGGEQQRVAVARAYAARPALLLADEPTGNLDSANGERVMDLLLRLHREQDSTLILVTHNHRLASRAERIVSLRDGRIVSDEPPGMK